MQFSFMTGCGTTNVIFILRQLQEKYVAKKKKLYFAFVDLEKTFDWGVCMEGFQETKLRRKVGEDCTIHE